MVSFRLGDEAKLSTEAFIDIEKAFAQALGYENHVRHCGVHKNTNNLHLNLAYNMFSGENHRSSITGGASSKGGDAARFEDTDRQPPQADRRDDCQFPGLAAALRIAFDMAVFIRCGHGLNPLLDMTLKNGIIENMNSRHRKTLAAIFSNPTPKTLAWDDIEALFKNIGCEVIEGDGSRVGFEFGNHRIDFHRPHSGKEAKPYQVKAARDFLKLLGVTP